MRRRPVLITAGVVGVVTAAAFGLARSRAPQPTSAGQVSSPVRVTLGTQQMRLTREPPAIRGSARITARVRDPRGGPPWAVRSYWREGLKPGARVHCAQLGRIVEGRFAWVWPGATVALRLPLGDAGTTVCAVRAPISEKLGVGIGGFPAGAPQVARGWTSIAWGVVDARVKSAQLEAGFAPPVELRENVFLAVRSTARAPVVSRLRVVDPTGGTRLAVPPGMWDEAAATVVGRRSGRRFGPEPLDPSYGRVLPADDFVPAARIPNPSAGEPTVLFVARDSKARPCIADERPAIGGRPVQTLPSRDLGLFVSPSVQCQFVRPEAAARPVVVGMSGSLGLDPDSRVAGREIVPDGMHCAARSVRRLSPLRSLLGRDCLRCDHRSAFASYGSGPSG